MSGGSDTVQTNNFPDWAIPAAQNYLGRSQQVADLPYQGYEGQTVAQLNPYQVGGYNAMAQRAMQGSPITQAAGSELTRTLNGGYLNNNPNLDAMVDLSARDVMRGMDTMTARSGTTTGHSGAQEATARALADSSAGIRGADYARERGFQQGAIGMAPAIANQDYTDAGQLLSAGQGFQGQEQRNLTDQYGRFTEARDYPQQQLATLGRGLGLNMGSSSTQPGQNGWGQALGTGLAAYSAYNGGGGGK